MAMTAKVGPCSCPCDLPFTVGLLAGMLWRVNGMVMLSKGANMIPMEELEGRMNAEAHRQLVVSSRDGKTRCDNPWQL